MHDWSEGGAGENDPPASSAASLKREALNSFLKKSLSSPALNWLTSPTSGGGGGRILPNPHYSALDPAAESEEEDDDDADDDDEYYY